MHVFRAIILLAALAPSLSRAQKADDKADELNLFKNGTMDTVIGWSGDRKYVELEKNRVMVLEAREKKTSSFGQEINTKGFSDVTLTFRYQTTDYKGRGLQLRGVRGDRSYTYLNVDLVADGQWHTYTWKFSEIRGSKDLRFVFEILEGTGAVLFDDTVAVGE